MPDKPFILKKIPLLELIDVLSQAYNNGADYIDLIGAPDNKGDVIQVQVLEEYMIKEDEKLDEQRFKDLI